MEYLNKLVSSINAPVSISNLQLNNRVVMAPMTQESSVKHIPGKVQVEHYGQRAKHGVGLIITEGTVIPHASANGHFNVPLMYSESALSGWRKVVNEVHRFDSKIFAQLWHVGGVREAAMPPEVGVPAVSPSGLSAPNIPNGKKLTIKEIDEVIAAYANAAKNAQLCGFDGIEIHAAHGYLIDQFLWQATNLRSDQYGGGAKNRYRFAAEVVTAIRDAVGPDFTIGFRWSQWKIQNFSARVFQSPEELAPFLQTVSEAGVDIFHTSTRRFWEPGFEGSERTLAGWTKAITQKPCIAVGGVGLGNDFLLGGPSSASQHVYESLIRGLEENEFDLIAVGRALLADPAWFSKLNQRSTKNNNHVLA